MKVLTTFLLQLVSQFSFCLRDCIKITRLFLAAVSINGLRHLEYQLSTLFSHIALSCD